MSGFFIKRGKKNQSLNFFLYLLKEIKQHSLKQGKNNIILPLIFLNKSLNNIYPELSYHKVGHRKIFYLPNFPGFKMQRNKQN